MAFMKVQLHNKNFATTDAAGPGQVWEVYEPSDSNAAYFPFALGALGHPSERYHYARSEVRDADLRMLNEIGQGKSKGVPPSFTWLGISKAESKTKAV
jgi:hypothetical protein